jgi:hypothetical protein
MTNTTECGITNHCHGHNPNVGNLPTYPSSATWVVPVPQTPHKCPVCEGKGSVAEDFYPPDDRMHHSEGRYMCRSCWGAGILWR